MIADYCEQYQLSSDPFSSDRVYFSETLSQFHEKVAHLSQFSVGFVVISGPRGSGKSVFARHYWEQLNQQSQECCLLDAGEHSSVSQLLGTLVDFLALPAERGAGTGQLLAELRAFIHNEFDDLAITVVIDNAHQLEDQTLAALVSLLQVPAAHASAFRFVLMSESDLASRLDRFEMPDVLVQDLEMPPMGLADAVAMLNDRLEAAGYTGRPLFNEAAVAPWWERADGNIQTLLDLARLWMIEHADSGSASEPEAGEPIAASPKNRAAGLPMVHVITVAGLLAGLGMVYLYSGGGDDQPPRVPEQGDSVALALPGSSSSSSSFSKVVPSSANTLSSASSSVLHSKSVVPSSVEVLSNAAAPGSSSSSVVSSASSAPVSSISASSKAPLRPPQAQYTPDEQEILSWPGSHYALQVLGVSTREAAQRYIRSQSNSDILRLYRGTRSGKPWYVVVAGRYANAPEARAAVSGLTATQKKAGPWARPVADLQEEIRSR